LLKTNVKDETKTQAVYLLDLHHFENDNYLDLELEQIVSDVPKTP